MMSQATPKRPLLSPRTRVILGVGIILLLVVLSFFAPPEGESSNVTGDLIAVPTVTITNLIQTVSVNRNMNYSGIRITVLQAMLATKFSDDRKRAGSYTVRVIVRTKNLGQTPLGVDYASSVYLVLPDGEIAAPKFLSVRPAELPGGSQTGFFDFPVSTQVTLSSLMLRFKNGTTVPLGTQ